MVQSERNERNNLFSMRGHDHLMLDLQSSILNYEQMLLRADVVEWKIWSQQVLYLVSVHGPWFVQE